MNKRSKDTRFQVPNTYGDSANIDKKIEKMNLLNAIQVYKSSDYERLFNMRNYYKKRSLEIAIRDAAAGKNPDGSMNSHQWRVGKKKGDEGGQELVKYFDEIQSCQSFEDIFQITEKVKNKIWRLGDLWSYDVALRIGFNRNLFPSKVYVQRGVIAGVKKALNGIRPRGRCIPLAAFPKELQQLEPYEVENFLCIWGKDKGKKYC